jgi:alcohol dehydrogenase (cytochrome c)
MFHLTLSPGIAMRRTLLGLAPIVFSVGISGLAAAQGAPTERTGAYTAAQAERGRRIYGAYCAACHGTELEGATGPVLAGPVFLARWGGGANRTAADLFFLIRSTMPKPAMGSLSPTAYLDVFTYLLQRNGVEAGTQALSVAPGSLGAVRLPTVAVAKPKVAPAFIAGERGLAPAGTGPDQAELTAAADPAQWIYSTGNYSGTRYSPLAQITAENIVRLGVVCAFQVGSTDTFHSNPVVYRGVMYITTMRETIAIDAAGCRLKWRYTWEAKDEELWPMNRGVAIKDGYVVRGTSDGYLVALDAADGHLLWARQVAKPSGGETITMPPMIFEDLVLIGPAGSENNLQGWIGAFRLADGSPVWRFNTVPRKGEPGAETWGNTDKVPVGGGAVWTPMTLDPVRGELYVPVTNPAPDLPAHLRPGTNLYTNSIVALDVRTGKLRWYDQLVPNDARDWDVTQVSPLYRGTVKGSERNLVATAGKDGMLRVLDRDSHERLFETPLTTRLNTEGRLPPQGMRVCPGLLGGVEWNGPALHPGLNTLYVPAVDWCTTFIPDDTVKFVPGQMYLGGKAIFDSTSHGWLTAIDASNGNVRWRYRSPRPMVAAVTTTAGGVVFTGEMTGDFLAFDAETGKELYRMYTGAGILGGVVSYAVDGKQYVATTSGGGSFNFGREGSPTVFVFGLRAAP